MYRPSLAFSASPSPSTPLLSPLRYPCCLCMTLLGMPPFNPSQSPINASALAFLCLTFKAYLSFFTVSPSPINASSLTYNSSLSHLKPRSHHYFSSLRRLLTSPCRPLKPLSRSSKSLRRPFNALLSFFNSSSDI